MLIAGLFGHRAAPEPAYAQWLHAVGQWIGAHWATLAVLIPVGGAILAGIVNHYLALARENRARRTARNELRNHVYADLAARLLAHCSGLIRAIEFDVGAWRDGNAALRARAQKADTIDALDERYVSFMAAVEQERRIVEELRTSGRGAAEGAHRVLMLYVPFIAEFGEATQARRLEKHANALLRNAKVRR
ncbi:MAG TPA: hypothetical protein VNG31_09345 [Candidatus Baltobacteraceae bacterium]|nr:hypothetical protein [Candidatus Baltobacteraceae bacterium]